MVDGSRLTFTLFNNPSGGFLLNFVNQDQVPQMSLSDHSMYMNPYQGVSRLFISKAFVGLKVWEG
jgi:hypothetical protein